jgi:hypothetical protein
MSLFSRFAFAANLGGGLLQVQSPTPDSGYASLNPLYRGCRVRARERGVGPRRLSTLSRRLPWRSLRAGAALWREREENAQRSSPPVERIRSGSVGERSFRRPVRYRASESPVRGVSGHGFSRTRASNRRFFADRVRNEPSERVRQRKKASE